MNANDNIGHNRMYKDTLFRWLFSESKENALSLYNAINGSNYTDVNDLEFRTLNDVIYMKFKNDVSFLVDDKFLCFIEHQSSFNPNMPLRGFFYAADSYRQLLGDSENIYGSKLIKIPVPQYIVLYNGPVSGMKTDVAYLRLSDAFEVPDKVEGYEWTAKVLNINRGFNEGIKDKCRDLYEYSCFIDSVKKYSAEMPLRDAIDRAIDECIEKSILASVLSKHRREVKDMVLTEFDQNKYGEICKAEGKAEGRAEGIEIGKAQGIEIGKAEVINQQKEKILPLIKSGTLTVQMAEDITGISKKEWNLLLEK